MLFRIVEEGLGTWLVLILSAIAFGLVHLGNENITVLGVVTTAAVAGVFLATAYVLTRRLWLPIGVHYGVNLVQGPIFGLPVSGQERPGLLRSSLAGPELLTGGSYGIEASVVTLVVGGAVTVHAVRRAHAAGDFVDPLWRRGAGARRVGGVLPELR